jgi:hypothetical protein
MIGTRYFKNKVKSYPVGELSFPKRRDIQTLLAQYLIDRFRQKQTTMFDIVGNPSTTVNTLLKEFKYAFGGDLPEKSHAFRRGCASILDAYNFK